MTEASSEQILKENNIEFKFSFTLRFLLFFTSLIFVFCSVDYFVLGPFDRTLNDKFLSGLLAPHFFSLFDVLIILICFSLIYQFGLNFKETTLAPSIVFIFAVVCFVLKMSNPNNNSANPILGLPLFSEVSNYTYLILLGTLVFIRKDILLEFFRQILIYTGYAVVIRSIILLLLFVATGGHSFFFGIKSALIEGDSLLIFGFFQSILLALFLINPKKKKYIIGWGILLLIEIFSSRRSPLFISLIANAFVFLLYYIKELDVARKIIILIVVLLTFYIVPIVISNISPDAKVYVDRYLGVFTSSSSNDPNTDSGHFDQSKQTTQAALKLGFWGVGYGNRLALEGAFEMNGEFYIHNVFAALWAFYGVFAVIYYLFLILIAILFLFAALAETARQYFPYVLLIYTVSVFYLCYMWAMYYTTLNFVIESKMSFFLLLLIVFVMRCRPKDIALVAPFKEEDN
jgi:hypothetical protein